MFDIIEIITNKITTQKVALKAIKNTVQLQIKVAATQLMTALISILMPLILTLLAIVVFAFILYALYLSALQSQRQTEQSLLNQSGNGTSSNAEIILGDFGITKGGSEIPTGTPTNGKFNYGTFKYHQDNENITAIDFTDASEKTEIRSTQAGTILYIGNPGGKTNAPKKWCPVRAKFQYVSYGNAVIIGNKNTGYATVFLHFDSLNPNLKIGDKIGYGTFLGYMGNTGCSSGKHLHYEIRKGNSVDSIKEFPSYGRFSPSALGKKGYITQSNDQYLSSLGDSITQKNGINYIVRFSTQKFENVTKSLTASNFTALSKLERKIYGPYIKGRMTPCGTAQVYSIKGNSDQDRIEFALNKRGKQTAFNSQSYQDWINSGVENSIDPSFLICMGIKESELGNKIKSLNNVGNVGNNDRGDTREFATPRDGIDAISWALNGKSLKQYNEIIKITRCDDPNRAPVYATNPDDYKELLGCTSAIKNTNIPDNWNFRLEGISLSSSQDTHDGILTLNSERIYDFYTDNSLLKYINKDKGFNLLNYKPKDLTEINNVNIKILNQDKLFLRQIAINSLYKLAKAYQEATKTPLIINKTYVDYSEQKKIENLNPLAINSLIESKAGFGEEQTGLTFDFGDAQYNQNFLKEYILDYNWLKENGYKYGFIQSYTDQDLNGYKSKEYHWRFIGLKNAKILKESNKTLQQFFKEAGNK